jgi:hypothetical protein
MYTYIHRYTVPLTECILLVNVNTLVPPMTVNMLRRKKSSYSKSGAYHAHEFNKSIGKGGPPPRDLRDMFEQEQDSKDGK